MTENIIEILLAIWIFGTGYPRGIKIRRGEFFAIGIGDWAWFFIDGDYIPIFLAYFPLPWPFVRVWSKLKWKELVEGKSKKAEKIKNAETGEIEDKFKEVTDLPNGPNVFIGERDEWVPSIRKFEPVTYQATVITKDGYELDIAVKFTFKVFRPIQFVRVANAKMLGDIETQNKLKTWALTKTLIEVHATNFDIMSDKSADIYVTDEDGNQIELTKYLDQKHFLGLGFKIFKQGWRIFNSPKAQKFFDLQTDGAQFVQQTKNAEEYGKLRNTERAIEVADADAQNTIIEKRIKSIQKGAKKLIKYIYEGKRKVAAAQPLTLVKIEHEADELGEKLFNKVMDKIPDLDDNTSVKQFRKEEESSQKKSSPKKQKTEEVTSES